MIWKDERLIWTKEEFGGIHNIRANPYEIWIPDLEVMNRIHDFPLTDEKLPKASVNNHGRVWLKLGIFEYPMLDGKFRLIPIKSFFPASGFIQTGNWAVSL